MGNTQPSSRARRFLLPLLLLLTLAVYAPTITCDFTNWDDPYTIAKDPGLNPPMWGALAHHWTHADMDIYMPLTQTLWAATATVARVPQPDAAGIRLNPYLFHILNLLFHLLSVTAVFSLLKMFVPAPAAFVGAAVFAVHPVMVEPVAWSSGLKDVLCGALSLIALRLFLTPSPSVTAVIAQAGRPGIDLRNMPPTTRSPAFRPGLLPYFASIAVYALALLAKPSAVGLPLVAGLLAVVALHWKISKTILRLLPWIFLAIPILMIAHRAQPAVNVPPISLMHRPLIAVDAIQFYLHNLVWPAHLGIDYGRTPQRVVSMGYTRLIPIAIALLIGLIILFSLRRRCTLPAAGMMVFIAALTPVLGFTPFDFQENSTVADHYLYVAMLGPALLIAALITRLPQNLARSFAAILIISLSLRTFVQIGVWSNAVTLMSHAVELNPASFAGHLNLGLALTPKSPDAAITQLQIACKLRPNNPQSLEALGGAYLAASRPLDAITAYDLWIKPTPASTAAWTRLAIAQRSANHPKESIAAFRHSLNLDATPANVWSNLASELAENGQLDKAIETYKHALQIDPNSPTAKQGLALAIHQQQGEAHSSSTSK